MVVQSQLLTGYFFLSFFSQISFFSVKDILQDANIHIISLITTRSKPFFYTYCSHTHKSQATYLTFFLTYMSFQSSPFFTNTHALKTTFLPNYYSLNNNSIEAIYYLFSIRTHTNPSLRNLRFFTNTIFYSSPFLTNAYAIQTTVLPNQYSMHNQSKKAFLYIC